MNREVGSHPPPGWRVDPKKRAETRYWDGSGWTSAVRDHDWMFDDAVACEPALHSIVSGLPNRFFGKSSGRWTARLEEVKLNLPFLIDNGARFVAAYRADYWTPNTALGQGVVLLSDRSITAHYKQAWKKRLTGTLKPAIRIPYRAIVDIEGPDLYGSRVWVHDDEPGRTSWVFSQAVAPRFAEALRSLWVFAFDGDPPRAGDASYFSHATRWDDDPGWSGPSGWASADTAGAAPRTCSVCSMDVAEGLDFCIACKHPYP